MSAQDSEARHIWVGLVGFFVLFCESGVRQILNVFAAPVMESFNCTKATADTVVIVIPTASSLMAGPLVAVCYQLWGARVCVGAGGALASLSFMLASQITSIEWLYPIGIAIGVGCGLMRNSILSVQCEYFEKHRNAMMSFVTIGPGIGVFVLPRIVVPLMKTYSWTFAWQLIAVLFLVCSLLALPISRKSHAQKKTLAHFTGIKVWSHSAFISHCVCAFFASCCCIIYLSQILALMKHSGIEEPAFVYSLNGVASIIGRALLTGIMHFNKIPLALIMVANYAIAQSAIFAAAFCHDSTAFIVQNFTAGFGIGLFQASLPAFLVLIVGPQHLPGALGFTNLVNGLAAFIAIGLTESIITIFSLRSAFYLAIALGSCAILGSVVTSTLIMKKAARKAAEGEMEKKAALLEAK